jgi:peptide/nickel transport system ATP-binding protein
LQPDLPNTRAPGPSGLLTVSNLAVTYGAPPEREVPAIRAINLGVAPGEIVGVLGESGCGKSTLAASLLRLLPARATVSGEILFQGRNLLQLRENELRPLRGAQISLIHQDPGLSLSPVMRVGDQIAEVLRAHVPLRRAARRDKVTHMLEKVGFRDPERIYRACPHELSGGELHRVVIAQALVCEPDLLIADEPTGALDVAIQAGILQLLLEFNQTTRTAILFITHNPVLLAGVAHRVLVMYGGRVVEEGNLPQLFARPLHPYTQAFLRLVPRSLRKRAGRAPLPCVPEFVVNSGRTEHGCAFEPRCGKRTPICAVEQPQEESPDQEHRVSCFNHGN